MDFGMGVTFAGESLDQGGVAITAEGMELPGV